MLDSEAGIDFYEGRSSLLYAQVAEHKKDHLTELTIGPLSLLVPQFNRPVNSKLRCRINATDISLCLSPPVDSSITNILAATVTQIAETGIIGERLITLEISAQQYLLAMITYASTKRLKLDIGCHVWAQIKSVVIL